MSSPSPLLRRGALGLTAALLALSLFTTPAHAAKSPKAKVDRIEVLQRSAAVKVPVLANDLRLGKLRKVKLKASGTARIKLKVVKVKGVPHLKVRPAKSTKPGKYKVVYTARTAAGMVTKSKLVITVVTPAPAGVRTDDGVLDTVAEFTEALTVAPEYDGEITYDRKNYKHWNAGLLPKDGCDTRREVLLAEATILPAVGTKCALTGGQWISAYDGAVITDAGKVDLDHMVPLSEAHDSGAWAWDAARREAYANDQGDPRSLVGVSATSNRSKSDRDPAEWMPPLATATCRYLSDWVATKYRWSLALDQAEKASITSHTACAATEVAPVTVVPRPEAGVTALR
ncbi:DUF1524 domain-containing protein [Nocardioides yefusunii]|uniref:DUF1524 domain-containing protein n=1 Tax=Nocardioides yefusunii TaxID=2500546 RepID=A0ABW1QTW2_9ACTN|nr:DUF1524 domain-containing protein [Nocardioides yefusunii]